jgi:hypothetical protein
VSAANAQCTVPNQITNGQVADATQIMANFNAKFTHRVVFRKPEQAVPVPAIVHWKVGRNRPQP